MKYKIAIIVNGRPHEGGVTTYINTISSALRNLGHSVDVITLFWVSKYRETKPSFVKKTDEILKGRSFLSIPAYIASQIIIFWHLFHNHFKKKYDVLYAIDVSAANIALFTRRFLPANVILRIGASIAKDMVAQEKIPAKSPFLKYFYRQEKKAYARVDSILPNSTWSLKHIKSLCPEAKALDPIISPVSIEKFNFNQDRRVAKRQEFGFKTNDIIIFFPSRLDPRKGALTALRALQELQKENNSFHLLLAGRGTEKEKIEKLVKEWGLKSHTHLLGMVPHHQMPGIYNMSDIVVVPSISHEGYEEPLANSVIEGMACGVPVIASAIGGLKDFVQHGQNGILIQENDYQAMAKTIKHLLNDNTYRDQLIQGGFNTINTTCTPEIVATKITKIIDNLKQT